MATRVKSKNIQLITIDASNQSLGRVASEVASKLRGKHLVNFAPNNVPQLEVIVSNIDKIKFTGTKMEVNKYHKFSGYPGGLKTTTLKQEWGKNPIRLFRSTVQHMLPKNRLNSRLMRNLKVYRAQAL